MIGLKRMLFATDGSESAKKAEQMALTLLDAWKDATLVVLHVIPIVAYPSDTMIPQTVFEAEQEFARVIEHEATAAFKSLGNRVHFKSVTGYPAVSICDAAEEEGVDLIIVGSHGRGAIDRLFLGSVSNSVLHRAKVPVLVVR